MMHPGKYHYEIQATIRVEADTDGEADRIAEMLLEFGRERANKYSHDRAYVQPVTARISSFRRLQNGLAELSTPIHISTQDGLDRGSLAAPSETASQPVVSP